MRGRPVNLVGACVLGALVGMPGVAWAAQAANPDHHHHDACTSRMASSGWAEGRGAGAMALDAKLEELVKKMDAATGTAKIDAMAELLTVLVNDRRTMGGHMMANMTSMMDMMSMMSMKHNMGMTGMKEKMPEATQPKE